ncbi:unnamed protein product [Hermetia illucens]|uniref:Gustatory receptor n=1 Tax=Hermetia illucens TaxID=343691 RepID=A0A7R8USR8_HERIL|nr:unnamed protein product [Hermetia illucens]
MWGFLPLYITNHTSEPHYILIIWSLLQIVLILYKLLLAYLYADNILYTTDAVGRVHYAGKIISLFICHLTILIDSILKREKIRNFYYKIMILNKMFPHTLESYQENARKDQLYMIKFFGLLTYTAFAEFKFLSKLGFHAIFIRLWIFSNSSYFPMSMYYFYSILLFDVVHLELERINKDLKSLVCFTVDKKDYRCCDRFDSYVSGRIRQMQFKYCVVYSMVEDLNRIFGWSWTMSVLSSTIAYYCSFYWFYHGIINDHNDAGLEIILTAIPYLTILVFTLRSSNACKDQVR